MTRLRARIAERLLEAQQTQAQLTTFNEIDLKAVMDVRAKYKDTLREEARREARLHVLLREGGGRGAEEIPGGQRLGRRQRHRLPRVLRHRRRGLDRTRPHGAGPARCRPAELRRHREEHRRVRHAGARGQDHHRGTHRRHVLHHQRRHLRLAAVHAHRQHAAERDPRHARDQGAADGGRTARSRSAR